jgi:hypothetical protein
MVDIVGTVIGLVVGAVVIGGVLPTGINSLNLANQTGWTAAQIGLFSVLSIITIAVIVATLAAEVPRRG